MRAFGEGPWGRRLRNIVLGALTPLLIALLGMALFPERRRVGWIAGALLAVDPLHIVLSRGTFEEVQAVFFLAAAALAIVHTARGRQTLLLGGVALGAALASKHCFPFAALALGAYVLAAPRADAPPLSASKVILRFWLVAGAVYVATYLPWFGRGYGLGEASP
jgi:dolichyl-phosphate-mannose-protein mannosyltransferase